MAEHVPLNTTIAPHQLLLNLINMQKTKEENQDIWKNSSYKDFVKLQSNNAGNVGENFIQHICTLTGIQVSVDGTKTKKLGGGVGDGTIKDKSVEIKTAHQGCSSHNFQHELGEIPWKANYMIFVDISPGCLYLTIFPNFTEEHYKSKNKCDPYFPTKSVTWRKEKGAFKLDTSVGINEENVKRMYTFKMIETTPMHEIADFVNSAIV